MIGRNSDSELNRKSQLGFTLIEALIAFVVLTVGLLGASLFHSQLLGEFTQSKAEYEATRIAESEIEILRRTLSTVSNASQVITSLESVLTTSTTSPNGINYTVSLASISGPTSAGLVSFDLTIGWNSPDEANTSKLLVYPHKLSWNLNALATPDNVSLEPSSTSYEGDIPVPLGTLTRLNRERLVISPASAAVISEVSGDAGSIFTADQDGDLVAGVKVGDDYVQLVQLSDPDNEIFQISGRVLLDLNQRVKTSGNTDLEFGCTYSGSSSSAICSSDTADDDILDIAATGGAGCLIYRVDSFDNYDIGWYTCLAGTGWNGQIQPYVLDVVTNGNGEDSVTAINGSVCAPPQRGYRYIIIDPLKVDDFEDRFGTVDPKVLYSEAVASSALVGQSGLVRFYLEEDINRTAEGVINDSYFWLNPDYIRQAASTSANFTSYRYSVYNNTAYNLPGDVAYQDFYIHGKKSGNSFVECDIYGYSQYSAAVSAEHIDNPYYTKGMPADNYTPTDSAYSESMFNRDYTNYSALVLGYTLSRFTVAGSLSFPESVASAAQFVIGGNPEPVISIECQIDESSLITAGGTSSVDYSCAIPAGWSGTILGYLANEGDPKPTDAVGNILATDVYDLLDASGGVCSPTPTLYSYASVASDSSTDDDVLSTFQLYFKALGAPSSSADPNYDFSGLATYPVPSAAESSVENADLSFSWTGGTSCNSP